MKTIAFFLTLFSFSTFAAAPVKVPAKNLLEAARSIIAALQRKRPALGPAWEVRGTFEASSISPQIPPFTPNEQASVTLK